VTFATHHSHVKTAGCPPADDHRTVVSTCVIKDIYTYEQLIRNSRSILHHKQSPRTTKVPPSTPTFQVSIELQHLRPNPTKHNAILHQDPVSLSYQTPLSYQNPLLSTPPSIGSHHTPPQTPPNKTNIAFPAAVPAPARSSKSNKPRSKVWAPTTLPATAKATAPARRPSPPTPAPPASARIPARTTPALRASRASPFPPSLMAPVRT